MNVSVGKQGFSAELAEMFNLVTSTIKANEIKKIEIFLKKMETQYKFNPAVGAALEDFSLRISKSAGNFEDRGKATELAAKALQLSCEKQLPPDVVRTVMSYADPVTVNAVKHASRALYRMLSLETIKRINRGESFRDCGIETSDEVVRFVTAWENEIEILRFNSDISDEDLKKINKVAKFQNLQVLNLSNSSITDTGLLSFVQNYPQLKSLDLESCTDISAKGVLSLVSKAPSLQNLNLTDCYRTTDEIFEVIASLSPNLKVLNLNGFQYLTDACIQLISQKCPGLQCLDISDCRELTDASLKGILGQLPMLMKLEVSGCSKLTVQCLRNIEGQGLPLQDLSISCCDGLTAEYFEAIAVKFPHLNFLSLRSWFSNASGPASFTGQFSQLKTLILPGQEYDTLDFLGDVLARCPKLEELKLSHCGELTDARLGISPLQLTELRRLHFIYCKKITDAFLLNIAGNSSKLISLSLRDFKQISGADLAKVFGRWQQLEELDLSFCSNIIDAELARIISQTPRLRHLVFRVCPLLTDATLLAIAKSCPQLQTLCLGGCPLITDGAVKALPPHIKVLQ